MFNSSQPISKKFRRAKPTNISRSQPEIENRTSDGNHSDESKIFVVILPYICDSNSCPIKQPILTVIGLSRLVNSGFNLPFEEYKNVARNLFEFELQGKLLLGKLIAVAGTREKLKEELRANISSMPDLNNLRKIVKIDHLKLIHKPLLNRRDIRQRTKISASEILNLFSVNKDHTAKERSQKSEAGADNRAQAIDRIYKAKDQSQDSSIVKDDSHVQQTENQRQNDSFSTSFQKVKVTEQITTKSKRLEFLRNKITKLEERKNLLSEYDTTGLIIRSLIEVSKELLELIDEDNLEYEMHTNHFIPQPDSTYKNLASNRIFLEGILPLELSSYQKAVKKARLKNPGSFAYQLIKYAFPKIYVANVTLGKREMSAEEIESKVAQQKKPLAYVFGFDDPLDKPFSGECCVERGDKRVRALIDHIFRKSGRLEYTNHDESKVRGRIIKELSRRNAKSSGYKRENPTPSENDESYNNEESDYFYSFDGIMENDYDES